MRLILFFISLIAPLSFFAQELTLQQKFTEAQAGDYIVTAQEGNYSLLFIRSITADILLLEEIAVPQTQIELKTIDWKHWVKAKAPGHTSWTLYEIDRSSGALIECFSYSKNGWLYLDQSEQFLAQLFKLPLKAMPPADRKKIGPPPSAGETDSRALWNPPAVFEGKKIPKASFDVMQTRWPDDGSRLSLCFVELYFSQQQSTFPFPYWLEVHSPHYAFKMRTIDSGHSLVSPMTGTMPHRPPQILSTTQKTAQHWKLLIQTPAYFQKLHLFALDLTGDSRTTIQLPFTLQDGKTQEEKILQIATSDIDQLLSKGHRYRFILIPQGSSDIYVESEEIFTW